MLLKSLILHGFKTFSDKTILSFDNGITAIVGPNGSGKSNISDAIRWVLGEQSTKSLRCSKMEDVIFNGTPQKKAHGFAQATIILDDPDDRLGFGADVAVTRRYHRSGESEYLVNNKPVRLKDVHELFMDTGLGRDGYAIISQGKIDSIVASKAEDRREIFEEAAGISKFRYRKADAENRLKNAKENILRLSDIVTELKDRLDPLCAQAEKAKKYLKLAEKRKALEIGLWLSTIDKSAQVIKNHDEKLTITREHHEQIQQELSHINAETERVFTDSNKCVAKVEDVRGSIANVEKEISENSNKIAVLENDITHNNNNIQRINLEIAESEQSVESLDAKVAAKREAIHKLSNKVNEKKVVIDEHERGLDSLQHKADDSSNNLDKITKGLSELSVQESEAKVRMITSESAITDLELRIHKIDSEMANISEKVRCLDIEQREYMTMSEDVSSKITELESEIKACNAQLIDREGKVVAMKSNASKLGLNAEDKIRKVRLLQELENNLEGFVYSVKAVIKEAEHNKLSGIRGPLSRLIKVDSKYEIAIGTALGSMIQNIVVNTEEDAKKAILFLKQKRAGRATFLPIDTINGNELDISAIQGCSGFVGLASNLCDVSSEYRSILRFVLGKVVVAKDMDTAVSISRQNHYKFRVVTLDGQVVNVGGALTGGAVSKGTNIIGRASEIKRLQAEYADVKEKAQTAKAEADKECTELERLRVIMNEQKSMLSITKDEYYKICGEIKRCELELNNTHNLLINYNTEKAECVEKVEKFVREKNNAQTEIAKLQSKIKGLNEMASQETIGHSEIIGKREVMVTQMQTLKLELFSYEKDIAMLESEIGSICEMKIASNSKVEALKVQVEKVKEATMMINSEISTTKGHTLSLNKKKEDLEQQIAEISRERMSLEQKITDLRRQENEKNNDKNMIGRELSKLEERKDNFQKEYDGIIARLWDEYELTRSEAYKLFAKVENDAKATKELNELKAKIKALGDVNVAAIDEFKDVSERYEFMVDQISDVEKSRDELCRLIQDLTFRMKDVFISKFNQINTNFKASFTEMFGGGNAELCLTDPMDTLHSGVEVKVCPPGKTVNRLEALSGGERALVAISLYFAIMQVNPPPFCILDEIEAALDEVNISRFAAYLRKLNEKIQFIVISHRRGTMEEADVLYGVTMYDNEGISRLLKLDIADIAKSILVNAR